MHVAYRIALPKQGMTSDICQGRIQDFFRRGCTRLLLLFNTNKPHSSFFLQNTGCIRKPQVISGGGGVRTPCTLPLDPPLFADFVLRKIIMAIATRKPEYNK